MKGAVEYTATATNLNDSSAAPILVTGIEDLHQTLNASDNTSCDVYCFSVVAKNVLGSSVPSECVISVFPALADISAVRPKHLVTRVDCEFVLTINLNVRQSDPANMASIIGPNLAHFMKVI